MMLWVATELLTEPQLAAVHRFFETHPVFRPHLDSICVALTGSFAFGLGGPGADLDVMVLCPDALFADIRAGLIRSGRAAEGDDPGEDIAGVVGDYTLEATGPLWELVREHRDLTQAFICAHLVPLGGQLDLATALAEHCRRLPGDVAEAAGATENAGLDQSVYAYLRSFQTGDSLGRLLSRANIIRAALRLAFLAERQAPPYDKHLARLAPHLSSGPRLMQLVTSFVGAGPAAEEPSVYGGVAAAPDWRQMYTAAAGTPVMEFTRAVRSLLQQ